MSGVLHGVVASLKSAAAAVTDAFFNYVSLLLPGTGTNGAQNNTFIDGSANAFTVTRNGNTTQGTFGPFSQKSWSNYFDGNGDYLTVPDNAALNMGTSDFTLEAWVYLTATPTAAAGAMIFNKDGLPAVSTPQYNLSVSPSLKALFNASAVPNLSVPPGITGSTTLSLNTWNHIAATRVGTNATLWVNGVSDGTTSTIPSNLTNGARALYVGYENGQSSAYNFPGFISDARIVKGTAVYTANFTPPTAPLTAITNTSLLLNFANAGIVDAATFNNMETIGDAQISSAQAKWGSTSIAFDGTGDSLPVIGASPFGLYNQLTAVNRVNTIEMWLYVTAFTSPRAFLVGSWVATPSNAGWTYDVDTSGNIFVTTNGAGSTVLLTNKVVTSAWQHLAFVNNGSTINIYLNGALEGSLSCPAPTSTITPLYVGRRSDGSLALNGYIQDLRVTHGIARYTSNFTAPTAAFPTL